MDPYQFDNALQHLALFLNMTFINFLLQHKSPMIKSVMSWAIGSPDPARSILQVLKRDMS